LVIRDVRCDDASQNGMLGPEACAGSLIPIDHEDA
jgi:hypothetical protein